MKRVEGAREAGGGEVDLRAENANERQVVRRQDAVEDGEGQQVLRRVAGAVTLVPQLGQQREELVRLLAGEEGEERHAVQRRHLQRRWHGFPLLQQTVHRLQKLERAARRVAHEGQVERGVALERVVLVGGVTAGHEGSVLFSGQTVMIFFEGGLAAQTVPAHAPVVGAAAADVLAEALRLGRELHVADIANLIDVVQHSAEVVVAAEVDGVLQVHVLAEQIAHS